MSFQVFVSPLGVYEMRNLKKNIETENFQEYWFQVEKVSAVDSIRKKKQRLKTKIPTFSIGNIQMMKYNWETVSVLKMLMLLERIEFFCDSIDGSVVNSIRQHF